MTDLALQSLAKELHLNLPWIETQTIVSQQTVDIKDINNDLERELVFYKQALDAARLGKEKVLATGLPFSRPDDYFAEMVKSDAHMLKVRQRLLDEEQSIKASEDAKKQRELKKFGKKIQVETLKQRQAQKTSDLQKIQQLKKKHKGGEIDNKDDFGIEVDNALDNAPSGTKRDHSGKSRPRQKKDAKFGFGGKKRHAKSNTLKSTNDISGFSSKKMKAPFSGKPKSDKKSRPGKQKRQATRSKKM